MINSNQTANGSGDGDAFFGRHLGKGQNGKTKPEVSPSPQTAQSRASDGSLNLSPLLSPLLKRPPSQSPFALLSFEP